MKDIKQTQLPLFLGEIQGQLTRNAPTILEKVLQEKKISTNQILELIHPNYRSGRKLIDAIDLLTKVFTSQGIFVTYAAIKKDSLSKLRLVSGVEKPVIHLKVDERLTRPKVEESMDLGEMEKDFELIFENVNKLFTHDLLAEEDWYLNSINHKILSKESSYDLVAAAQKGNIEARNIFVVHNQKLIVYVVRRHFKNVTLETGAIEFNDLFQEGAIGLCKAIERFDLSLGLSLTTYAYWWIFQSITRALADYSLNIRLPVHIHERLLKYRKVYSLLEMKAEQKPDIIEIAEKMNITVDKAYMLQALNERKGTVSLDQPFSGDSDEDDEKSFESILSDKGILPETTVDRRILREKIIKSMKRNLSMKEFFILEKRFGLDGLKPLTLEKIGEEFDVTRERIRQLEVKAIESIACDNELRRYAAEYLDLQIPDIPQPKVFKLEPGLVEIPQPIFKSDLQAENHNWRVLKTQMDNSLMSRIVTITSKYYGIPVNRIFTETKRVDYIHAREVTIYVLVTYKVHFSQIERKFDMGTESIKNTYLNIKKQLERNQKTEKEIEFIVELLSIKN